MSSLFKKSIVAVENGGVGLPLSEDGGQLDKTEEIAPPLPQKPITLEESVLDEANAPIVRADKTENINFGEVLGQIANGSGEETPVALINKLSRSEDIENQAKNMAMKAVIPHTGSYTAAQFMADYNDILGMPEVGVALRNLCDWQYHHSCGFKGERAKQAFAALNEQEQKEFLLQKEAKGMMPR